MKMEKLRKINLQRKWIAQIRKQAEGYELQEKLVRMISKSGRQRKYLREELDKLVASGVLLRTKQRRCIRGAYTTIYCVAEDTSAVDNGKESFAIPVPKEGILIF